MNCKKCGYLISSQDQVCPNCGEPNEFFVNQPIMPNAGVDTAPVAPAPTTVTPEPAPAPTPVAPVAPEAPAAPEVPVQPAPAPVAQEPFTEPVAPVAPTPMPDQTAMPNQGINPSVGISQTQITPTKEKSNKGFIFLIIFLLLIIAGLGTFIGYKMLSGDNSSSGGGSANNGGGSGNNGGGGVQPVEVDTSSKITVNGIEFTLPDGITKKEVDGYTALVDQTNGYILYIDKVFGSINLNEAKQEMMAAESTYKTNLEAKGATYIGMNDYSSSGINYFVVTYTINSIYGDQYVANILGNSLVTGEVVYTSGNKDIAYQTLAKILNSAKEDSSSSFAPSTETTSDLANGIRVISAIQ